MQGDDFSGKKILFLNARYHAALEGLGAQSIKSVQWFKPYADGLERAGFANTPSLDFDAAGFDAVFLLSPKNQIEAEFLIALGASKLKADGVFFMAADNKAGGTRLKKMLQKIGFEELTDVSKNKCRAVRAQQLSWNDTAQSWLDNGRMKTVLEGAFTSRPGIFGWNKIDAGSEILLQTLPQDLKGVGADFGCGYGYLARSVLTQQKVKTLFCIDADARALECCKINIDDARAAYDWLDLTAENLKLPPLDFIVMNPPFHEGKKESYEIGRKFILNAHQGLRRKAKLYMVANAHLPYEEILTQAFFSSEKLFEGSGFKVFTAVK